MTHKHKKTKTTKKFCHFCLYDLMFPLMLNGAGRSLPDYEYREVDRTVGAVLAEAGERREVVALVVLNDDERTGLYESRAQNHAGDIGKTGHIVGRVGPHHVVGPRGRGNVAQRVATHKQQVLVAKLVGHFLYKPLLRRSLLDSSHSATATREELEAHRARAGKEVEGIKTVEVDVVLDYVKYIFAGKVGCRPRGDVFGHIETAAPILASYYSHSGKIIKGNGALKASLPARSAADGNIIGITWRT